MVLHRCISSVDRDGVVVSGAALQYHHISSSGMGKPILLRFVV